MLHRQLENSGLLMVWSEKIINSKSDVQVKITVLYVLLWNIVIDICLRLLCITSANFKFEQCLLVRGGRLEQAGMRAGGQNFFFLSERTFEWSHSYFFLLLLQTRLYFTLFPKSFQKLVTQILEIFFSGIDQFFLLHLAQIFQAREHIFKAAIIILLNLTFHANFSVLWSSVVVIGFEF